MTVRFKGQSPFIIKDFVGLSTDAKPTDGVNVKSTFYETDTGNEYIFDGVSWQESRLYYITYPRNEYLAEQGYVFGAERRIESLADNGTLFIQIEATTKPVTLVFGASVEALSFVDSFIGTTLANTTPITPYNYKPSSAEVATAIVRTSTSVPTTLGTQRGSNQTGSGSGGNGVGGSTTGRPTTLAPGEKLTLRITNKGGNSKSVSVAVYWNEI